MSLQAANPAINATVTASAGSGKTYMLVTRILRLLLDDAKPGSILALTFTRKAAAEMQQRLSERLYQLATVDDKKLLKLLQGLDLDAGYAHKARGLYEAHQYCDYPVRTLTFHSFCQDLLSRFPLEADVPPNFALLESADLLIQQARDALFNEATLNMQGELATHLHQLMTHTGGLFNLDKVLNSFLQHRSDWWAYIDGKQQDGKQRDHEQQHGELQHDKQLHGQQSGYAFASSQLAQKLDYSPDKDPITAFFNEATCAKLLSFARLLGLAEGKKNLEYADTLANWLVNKPKDAESFALIRGCFLTQKNEPLVQGRKDTPTLRKKINDDNADELLEIHDSISARIISTLEQLNRQHCWQLNDHWYFCGEQLVNHYQTLKQQQRLLDFTDLEWRSYKLLQDSDNALWIQYKLDQQIQHLLIDEFQDTNPTQWQLILPLLEEMAAAESDKKRSVFLVGDEKQSIYSFRRAKPELQQQAANWLTDNLQAQAFPLNKSWRSSPAIIDTVNAVFQQDEFKLKLPAFEQHETHHKNLPGKVEVLSLWRSDDPVNRPQVETVYCRNPLQQARAETPGIHQQEARQIAEHIQQLIKNKTAVVEDGETRPVNYDDIFILLRKRAHVGDYERALREAGITYLGTNRGTFLTCLEIQDMLALIDTLLTPFNNLALAQVLKSPLFSASDDDLQLIAHYSPNNQNSQKKKETKENTENKEHSQNNHRWYNRLQALAEELDELHPISRAWFHLSQWRELSDKIPVHDLLDKIFADADVLERYHRATPAPLQPRVQANLTLFLEMALDLDSGRYPSLMHFLFHLRSLKKTQSDAPDEAPMETREPRVRIMTIHASKGLEAPVVYLADTISVARDKSSLSTLVDWPVTEKQPQHFQLIPSSSQQDSFTAQLNQQQKNAQEKEDANLLYVALTRARQYLFISGCLPGKGRFLNWYQPVFDALQALTGDPTGNSGDNPDGQLVYCSGDQSPAINLTGEESTGDLTDNSAVQTANGSTQQTFAIDPALRQKIDFIPQADSIIAPSYVPMNLAANETVKPSGDNKTAAVQDTDEDAQQRGIIIHRMLELLNTDNKLTNEDILQQLSFENPLESQELLTDCLDITQKNISLADLQSVFKPQNALHIYNECPIQYMQNKTLIYGIIDRLVVSQNELLLIDYKTHQQATADNLAELAQNYQQQMQHYADGARLCWPDKKLSVYLLFTQCAILYPVHLK